MSSLKTIPFFIVRVSDLSHFVVCPHRSKSLVFNRDGGEGHKNKYMVAGIQFHNRYSAPYKSFDRRLLRYKLWENYGNVLRRNLENIEVRGKYDDLRVLLRYHGSRGLVGKAVSIIEVKTTSRRYVLREQIEMARFQLQLYIWIMEPLLRELGYELHSRHYVEFYSQKDGHLMKRVVSKARTDMEEYILGILDAWRGQKKIRYPDFEVCKHCPKHVKENCWRWKSYEESRRYSRLL